MTLYQIRAFIAVAQEGGFTAAARSLGLSHSTLNSQIQALEREHGTELFLRRGRRVELSALGVELLPLARRMFALEGDMTALLADTGKQRRGSLKIAAVGPFHVTEMIEAYHAVRPHIHISVGLGNSEFVLDALDKYTSDVGVVASRFPDARYHTQLYGHYPVVAFVHADHPFARQDAIPQEALSDQRLIMRERGSTTRKALEHALLQHKVSVRIAMEIGSREALREAVARGLGIGTVSASEYVPDPRLRPVRIEGDVVSTHIHVCCLRERRDSPLISSFFDAIARRPGRQAGIAAVHASKQHGAAVPIA